ncbi:predicted protein [Naegleria gruberi]|uniref:Predicted protein n=1 Tax=Naegleria gruberi TaxID=5762 RepID=D2W1F6_NAEGR|nr:uncharacterized protein NAEGRDRAFT_75199 [Naegleria gruberi]EFC37037.1 predicted protein [Naegleria gruberi]|eukprot:XP_002669781.1 predicted protein [Naegleria gruberi strain NEG-M]
MKTNASKAIASQLCHDEILNILQFLNVKQIVKCLLINTNWNIIGSSNIIWKPLYNHFFMNEFFKWDQQLQDISKLESNTFLPELKLHSHRKKEDSDIKDLKKETNNLLEKFKDKNGNVNYYQLFQFDCHYPQINESNVDIVDQLRNVDSISNIETLKQLIKHIWKDKDKSEWYRIIGTSEMILDKSNKLWKRKPILTFIAITLLVLFNKKRINYVDGIIVLTNVKNSYTQEQICEMPILAFCKMISSNEENISKLCSKHNYKKMTLGAFLKVSDKQTGKISSRHPPKPDINLTNLKLCFRSKNDETFIAVQSVSDNMNPDVLEFAPSFFNAGGSLQCVQEVKAVLVENGIRFEIKNGAKYC